MEPTQLLDEIKRIQEEDYRPSYVMTEDELEYLRGDGMYPYIPFHGHIFLPLLESVLKATKGRKFVEAGSGGGALTWAASELGCQATGVEINPCLHDRAVKRFPQCQFILDDILEHDYSSYDIIYFYTPFVDHNKERQFEQRVASQAKTGAVIIGQWLCRELDNIVVKRLPLKPSVSYYDNIIHEKVRHA